MQVTLAMMYLKIRLRSHVFYQRTKSTKRNRIDYIRSSKGAWIVSVQKLILFYSTLFYFTLLYFACIFYVIVILGKNSEITTEASLVCLDSCIAIARPKLYKDLTGKKQCLYNTHCTLNCNEEKCDQSCNQAATCGLECDRNTCQQTCNRGECSLKCYGQSCDQTCDSKKCNLGCHGNKCAQTCQRGNCNLECCAGTCYQTCNRNCRLNCHGNYCEQSCTGLTDGASCLLQYDDVNNIKQECGDRETQCTTFIALTKAPTADSIPPPACTGEWPNKCAVASFSTHNHNH